MGVPDSLIITLIHSFNSTNFLFVSFWLFRATPPAYGSSQARGQVGAAAASLHHRHSKARSQPPLQATPQLTATPDPEPTERGQGSNLHPHGYEWGWLPLSQDGNSLVDL